MSAADQKKWQTMPMLAFDLETTGVNVFEERIVTAALVVDEPGKPPRKFTWLANPGIDIPEGATQVHGITTDHARQHGQDPAQVLFELTGRIALWMGNRFPVVAMNAAFDFTLLEAENRRHGIPTIAERVAPKPVGPIIDPFVMDKKVDQWRKGGRKLVDLCTHYGVPLTDAHTADADAAASVALARAIIKAKPQAFRGMTIGALHQAQAQWRRAQMDSLRAYFDREGKEHDGCNGSWPLMDPPPAPIAPAEHVEDGVLL